MKEMKNIQVRMTIEMHEFLRKQAFEKRVSINSIIIDRLEKYKKKCEEDVDI